MHCSVLTLSSVCQHSGYDLSWLCGCVVAFALKFSTRCFKVLNYHLVIPVWEPILYIHVLQSLQSEIKAHRPKKKERNEQKFPAVSSLPFVSGLAYPQSSYFRDCQTGGQCPFFPQEFLKKKKQFLHEPFYFVFLTLLELIY